MTFECCSLAEFKQKLDAVELLGLDYEVVKRTRSIVQYNNKCDGIPPLEVKTWTIVTKEVSR